MSLVPVCSVLLCSEPVCWWVEDLSSRQHTGSLHLQHAARRCQTRREQALVCAAPMVLRGVMPTRACSHPQY